MGKLEINKCVLGWGGGGGHNDSYILLEGVGGSQNSFISLHRKDCHT